MVGSMYTTSHLTRTAATPCDTTCQTSARSCSTVITRHDALVPITTQLAAGSASYQDNHCLQFPPFSSACCCRTWPRQQAQGPRGMHYCHNPATLKATSCVVVLLATCNHPARAAHPLHSTCVSCHIGWQHPKSTLALLLRYWHQSAACIHACC